MMISTDADKDKRLIQARRKQVQIGGTHINLGGGGGGHT